MVLLGLLFAAAWLVSTGTAAHLPQVLRATGARPARLWPRRPWWGGAGRGAADRVRPDAPGAPARVRPGRDRPASVGSGYVGGVWRAGGGGVHSVARSRKRVADRSRGHPALHPVRFGRPGLRTGLLSTLARVAQAGAPLLFGFLLDRIGLGVLALSAGLGLAAFRMAHRTGLRQPPKHTAALRARGRRRSAGSAHPGTAQGGLLHGTGVLQVAEARPDGPHPFRLPVSSIIASKSGP